MRKIARFDGFPVLLLAALAGIAGTGGLGAVEASSGADGAQPQTPAPRTANQDQAPDGQLSLVGVDDEEDGNGELDRRIAVLENSLARELEEADRVQLEQRELRARLVDLDEQILLARQIIELQEGQLAQLQASLAAEAEEQARLEAERAAAAAAEAEARAAAGFARRLLENPVYLVIGAAVFALAFAVLLMLRAGRGKDGEAGEAEEPEELVLVGEEEEIAEKINLAYSYHKMGETAKARGILESVVRSGNAEQINEAKQLLAIIDDSS